MLLRYEKLPKHCFRCGHIGHVVRNCPVEPTGDELEDYDFGFGSKGSQLFGGTARTGKGGEEFRGSYNGQLAIARKLVVGTSTAVGPPKISVSELGRETLTMGRDSRKQSTVGSELVGITMNMVNVARNLGEEFEKEELTSVITDTAAKEELTLGSTANTGKKELTSVIAPNKTVVNLREASVEVDLRHVGDKSACAFSSVSAVPVEIGPSMAQLGKEFVGLKEQVGRVEGFCEMEVDSSLATNKSQCDSGSGGNLEETGGARKKARPKVGKWKRWARDGTRFDSGLSSEIQLGKRGLEDGITQAEKKLKPYTAGVGSATEHDEISAGRLSPACREP
ncbi:hypothetical protein LWI29_038145 [Acer saccharum]|uniref:CCHC-type domain-containing protein n=1 Tax=Acer saccharum TaxID=4024 RepID=A0AA39VK44_ACESA|nr:hypothetical protein LWI29_038145 [Acer saccharum]